MNTDFIFNQLTISDMKTAEEFQVYMVEWVEL